MKKFCLIIMLLATAGAQQKSPKISYAPITIDGLTKAGGLVTIDGKAYVSVEALQSGKVTMLSPNSLGIYTFPVAKGVTAKLSGCLGEWLTDGDTRLRVTQQDVNGGRIVRLEAQTARNSVAFNELFQADKTYLLLRDGTVLDSTVNKFVTSQSFIGDFSKGQTQTGYLQFNGMEFSDANPGVKMVLRPIKGSPWTVDLTCSK